MKELLQFIGIVFGTTFVVVGSITLAAIIIIALMPDKEFKEWDKDKIK
jgi:hypothetical protein